MEMTLKQEKETKGTFRFGDGNGHNLYLTKDEITKTFTKVPDAIKVTIEAG